MTVTGALLVLIAMLIAAILASGSGTSGMKERDSILQSGATDSAASAVDGAETEPDIVPPTTAAANRDIPDDRLVPVTDYIPSIVVELRYSGDDNFTGGAVYDFSEAYLRYGTVKKLEAAQNALSEKGCGLKIWDAYRPVEAQFKLWEICPNPAYVSNPNTGFSNHSRGNTIDVTLVAPDDTEMEMPTDFDDFSNLADRDYSDIEGAAKSNVLLLESVMLSSGFNGYHGEWWHFTDQTEYPVIED